MIRAAPLLVVLIGSATALQMAWNEGEHSTHQAQLAFAQKAISTNCNVTVDAKAKTMYLESDLGKFTIADGLITDSEGKTSDSPPKALVCLGNGDAPSTGPALFFAASGAGYLFKKTIQGSPMDFYLNKHCWAKNNNVQYYLWLGNPQDNTGFMSKKDPDALPCKDGSPGNHYFVIAGMHKLLQEKPNSWIVSMDISDTFWTKSMAHTNLLDKFLDDKYDFIGGATAGGTAVFINGAIVAYKKSQWATDFAAEWFKNRCGSMNQLGMWASLFKIWKRDDPEKKFDFSTGPMSHYFGGAHDYARKHSGQLLKTPEEKAAMSSWCKSGKLPVNLHYPNVMIHANVGSGGVDGVSWRANMDRSKEPFICHNTMDRHRYSTCVAKTTMCADPEQCLC